MKRRAEVNEELKQALDESLPDEVVSASLERTLGEVRRKRRWRQGVTVAGVAGVVALGVLVWIRSGTTTEPVMAGAEPVERVEGSPPIRRRRGRCGCGGRRCRWAIRRRRWRPGTLNGCR